MDKEIKELIIKYMDRMYEKLFIYRDIYDIEVPKLKEYIETGIVPIEEYNRINDILEKRTDLKYSFNERCGYMYIFEFMEAIMNPNELHIKALSSSFSY